MPECLHKNLVLIREVSTKLRCKQCHLTINPAELENDYCPECFETTGKKQTEFETINLDNEGVSRYRCEDCGAIIKTDP